MRLKALVMLLGLILTTGKLHSHEFWIDPLDYTVATGDTVQANLLTGQNFDGVPSSFLPSSFARFDLVQGRRQTPVQGRLGDRPALNASDLREGLLVVVHETSTNWLRYDEWQKFVEFAEHKDFGDIAALHDARGLPREGFREDYIRYAKSLIAVGDGAGDDRAIGLRTEIVARANPYTDDLSNGLPVRLYLDGAPRAGAQVELFDRAPNGKVTVTLHRTSNTGEVRLPVTAGHTYLVDAVVLEPLTKAGDAVWRSLWASLTFAVPR